MERENDLVLFKNYEDPLIAQFHKALLQDNGIPCVIKDLGFNFPSAFFSPANAGIKILVRNRDLQSAFDLMAEDDDDNSDTDMDGADEDLDNDEDLDFDDEGFDDLEDDDLRFDEKEISEGFDIDEDFDEDFDAESLFEDEDLDDDFGFSDDDDL